MTSLQQLYTMTMDVHKRFRTDAHKAIAPRFNERFLLSLANNANCLITDDEFNILNITLREITPIPTADKEGNLFTTQDERDLNQLQEELSESAMIGPLVGLCKTVDQAKSVMSICASVVDKSVITMSLLAGRGRGKSAALGLAIAGAVSERYTNIFVTAPTPDNLQTFFEFLVTGLNALGYKQHTHYEIVNGSGELRNSIVKIKIFKDFRQVVQYITPNDKPLHAELLVIDEAAALPLPIVSNLLGSCLTLVSSTIHGYEGTGRSLSLKLLSSIKNLKQLTMEMPIRYASADPIERWMNDLLCLQAVAPRAMKSAAPHPSQCTLYRMNRETLFSYHQSSEQFLNSTISLFVTSHYKNTPNDLQLMSDAPQHELFVLLGPISADAPMLPDVLCALQVAYEGAITQEIVQEGLTRGVKPSGDLIPWTLSEQFQEPELAKLSGVRVVRIATHPDVQKMGYGSKALKDLIRFYQHELVAVSSDNTPHPSDAKVKKFKGLLSENLKPRKHLQPLLQKLSGIEPPPVQYIGTSFGITEALHNFWNKSEFKPLYIR